MVPINRPDPPHRRRQRGQAMTEFLVVALALMPLFLLIPMIAKYQDVSHMTQLAGRYAAFDATIRNDNATGSWKSETQLADEVRRRFFGDSAAPIKTRDVAGNFDAHRNLFWRGPDNQPLLPDFADVSVAFGPTAGATHASAFTATSDMAPFALAPQLGFSSRGIYSASVTVKLSNLPAGLAFYQPFDHIDLSMTRGTSLLLDPWTAKNAADVEARIRRSPGIFPAGSLADVASAVGPAVTTLDWPGGVMGPKIDQLEFWRDVVPKDRLQAR